jgi:hypothetical protein
MRGKRVISGVNTGLMTKGQMEGPRSTDDIITRKGSLPFPCTLKAPEV